MGSIQEAKLDMHLTLSFLIYGPYDRLPVSRQMSDAERFLFNWLAGALYIVESPNRDGLVFPSAVATPPTVTVRPRPARMAGVQGLDLGAAHLVGNVWSGGSAEFGAQLDGKEGSGGHLEYTTSTLDIFLDWVVAVFIQLASVVSAVAGSKPKEAACIPPVLLFENPSLA